jgi:hypothetical protein
MALNERRSSVVSGCSRFHLLAILSGGFRFHLLAILSGGSRAFLILSLQIER